MKIGIEYAIKALVDAMLPKGIASDLALHIALDLHYTLYKNDTEQDVRKFVHFLFMRPGNYTKVFMYVSDKPAWISELPADAWKLTADHSCWSSDGVDSPLNKLEREIRNEFPEKYRNEVSNFNCFHFSTPEYYKVSLKDKNHGKPDPKYLVRIEKQLTPRAPFETEGPAYGWMKLKD